MRDLAVLVLHLLATVARLVGPGGARSVVAESVLIKHQLLILNRSRKRSPRLRFSDRMVAGLCALLIRPGRLIRSAIVLRPSTLLSLHRALKARKYRVLFSTKGPTRPGPKGPSHEVVAAIVDMKRRNPSWGCPQNTPHHILRISESNGTISFEMKINNVKSATTITFDATAHAFWRLRHDATADTIVFETAASNGGMPATWTARRTITRELSVTAMRLELKAGSTDPQSVSPGTVRFDDVRAAR